MGHSSAGQGLTAPSSGRSGLATRTNVQERIVDFLRRRYPAKCAESVEADTGIPATTVAKWLLRGTGPKADAYAALLLAYGTDFLLATLPAAPEWLTDAARRERIAQLEARQAEIDAELAGLTFDPEGDA